MEQQILGLENNKTSSLSMGYGSVESPKNPQPPFNKDDEPHQKTDPVPIGKTKILKNVLVVSIGFMFLFTSFQSLSNLQSTLNKDDGLGTGGLSVVYGALVVSCMLFPSFVIAHLGCKWTVALSMWCYIVYMALNFYAVWETIIPASIIVGLGAATLWSAKCSYLTQLAVWYARLTGASKDDVINRFFGFFFMIFQTSKFPCVSWKEAIILIDVASLQMKSKDFFQLAIRSQIIKYNYMTLIMIKRKISYWYNYYYIHYIAIYAKKCIYLYAIIS